MEEWVPAFRSLAQDSEEVHAVMNTNQDDQGPANADVLADVLERAGMDPRMRTRA